MRGPRILRTREPSRNRSRPGAVNIRRSRTVPPFALLGGDSSPGPRRTRRHALTFASRIESPTPITNGIAASPGNGKPVGFLILENFKNISAAFVLTALILYRVWVTSLPPAVPIENDFAGTLTRGGATLPFRIHLTEPRDGQFQASVDLPDQGLMGYPIRHVAIGDSQFKVDLPLGTPAIRVNVSTGRIDPWTDEDLKAFSSTLPDLQASLVEPSDRSAYDLHDVWFDSTGARLAGRLWMPNGNRDRPAVVVLSEPDDLSTSHARFIADRLASRGIAALTFDRRGVGASGGDWRSATYYDLADDAVAAALFLREHATVDPARVGIWSLGEAGRAGALASAWLLEEIAFVVFVSSPVLTPAEQGLYRLRSGLQLRGFSPRQIDDALAFGALTNELAAGRVSESRYAEAVASAGRMPWFRYTLPREPGDWWWRWWGQNLDFDPAHAFKAIRCPVLALYGLQDTRIPARASAARMTAALQSSAHREFDLRFFPGGDHRLYASGEGSWPRLAPAYLEDTIRWICDRCDDLRLGGEKG